MNEGTYQVKAFREDGTPTLNRARFFESIEAAEKEAQEIAEAMTGGFAQISKWNDAPDFQFYEVVKIVESKRKPTNPRRAKYDDWAAREQEA